MSDDDDYDDDDVIDDGGDGAPPAMGAADSDDDDGGAANPANFADWASDDDGGGEGGNGGSGGEPTLCLFDDRYALSPEAALEQARPQAGAEGGRHPHRGEQLKQPQNPQGRCLPSRTLLGALAALLPLSPIAIPPS